MCHNNVGEISQVTTEAMSEHVKKLLKIPGSKLLFGGETLENHSIPSVYGAFKPTAVYVPLEEIVKDKNFELVTKEIFGPFQVNSVYYNLYSPICTHFMLVLGEYLQETLLFMSLGLWCLQIITDYKANQLQMVLDALERMHAHLTAAVVSNDVLFLQARYGVTLKLNMG